MKETISLFQKEVLLEMRQRHALAGLFLFVLSSVFICYLSFDNLESTQTFSALLWLVGIFSAFNSMAKSFFAEGQGVQLHLYSLANPRAVIISKSLYNALLVAALNTAAFLLFVLFFGTGVFDGADLSQFFIGLILGSTGLGIALTLIAGIAYKAGNNLGLMAILAFPVIMPLLITLVRFSNNALAGMIWSDNMLNLVILCVLNGSSLTLSVVLFPYLWRD